MGSLVGFVDSITEDYRGGLSTLQERMGNVFRESLAAARISTIDYRYALLEQTLCAFQTFSNASHKIRALEMELSQLESLIQNFTLDAVKTKEVFEPIRHEADEIVRYFRTTLAAVNSEIEQVFKQIEESPFGEKEYGIVFEDLVLSFFDTMFVHELVREEPQNVRYKGIKFDGYYNRLESFDAKSRTGFEFQQLLIECKNKTPKVSDLMQCFKYTLFFQRSNLQSIPLTLLVCRHQPGVSSSIWEINRKIFDKQIANETRLILILDMNALREMKNIKVNDGDPAKIIKDKIRAFC